MLEDRGFVGEYLTYYGIHKIHHLFKEEQKDLNHYQHTLKLYTFILKCTQKVQT